MFTTFLTLSFYIDSLSERLYRRWRRLSVGSRRVRLTEIPFHGPARLAEVGLWMIAIAGIGSSLFTYTSAHVHQARQLRYLERAGSGQHGLVSAESELREARADANLLSKRDGLLGILQIPRLGISSVVEEGEDEATLSRAVGHIPGTKLPGQAGNSCFAAHRDTYFRHLGDVKPGDDIIFKTASSELIYTVESTQIVDPSSISALSDTQGSTLTLVTCYPFHYIGSAPKRFIVTARLLEPSKSKVRNPQFSANQ